MTKIIQCLRDTEKDLDITQIVQLTQLPRTTIIDNMEKLISANLVGIYFIRLPHGRPKKMYHRSLFHTNIPEEIEITSTKTEEDYKKIITTRIEQFDQLFTEFTTNVLDSCNDPNLRANYLVIFNRIYQIVKKTFY